MARLTARIGAVIGLILLGCLVTPVTASPADQAASSFDADLAKANEAMVVDLASALSFAVSAAHAAERVPGRKGRVDLAHALWLQSEVMLRQNRMREAIQVNSRALAIAVEAGAGSKLIGDIYFTRGGISSFNLQTSTALSQYQESYKYYRKAKYNRGKSLIFLTIALLYNDAKDYNKALEYINDAKDNHQIDENLENTIYVSRASVLDSMGRYAEAEKEIKNNITSIRASNNVVLFANALIIMIKSELKLGKFKLADINIKTALSITKAGDAAAWRSQTLAAAAWLAYLQRDFTTANALIGEAFIGIDLTKTTINDHISHEYAFEIYMGLHEPAKALPHLIALKRLDDEATKVATSTAAAFASAQFDFAKLKQDELRRKLEYEHDRVQTQRAIFIGIAGTTVLIIILLGTGLIAIRRSRNEVRAANDDLALTNAQLGKALAAKTEFLATTSHEIRTPLNGILGMTQVMLADQSVEAGVRDRLTLVHDAGSTMKALVDDILDVAKMETGDVALEAAPFDLGETVERATRLWAAQARGKGLAFSTELAACPRWVIGDAARVRQIVFNLLSNAVKFTATGSVAVSAAEEDGRCRITVADTGIGIDPAKHEEIFEAFRQADAGTTRQYGGTGLGLAICRRLATAMEGTISVDSTLGRGATFSLVLPVTPAEPRQHPAPSSSSSLAIDLLVVEANPITRSMMRTLFAPHLDRVEFVASAADARARLEETPTARLLIDATADHAGDAPAMVAAADRAGTAVVVLIAAAEDAAEWSAYGSVRTVAKPVSGKSLIKMFVSAEEPLVTRAA